MRKHKDALSNTSLKKINCNKYTRDIKGAPFTFERSKTARYQVRPDGWRRIKDEHTGISKQ